MPDGSAETQPGSLLTEELEFYEEYFDEYATKFPDQYVLIWG